MPVIGNRLRLNVLGAALNIDWNNPYEPTALAIALIFGFSERWFSGILDAVQSKLGPAASPSTPTPTPAATPTITGTDPKKAKLNTDNKLMVQGTNFQSGATATVTEQCKPTHSSKGGFSKRNIRSGDLQTPRKYRLHGNADSYQSRQAKCCLEFRGGCTLTVSIEKS
jgi:hypothetical protein